MNTKYIVLIGFALIFSVSQNGCMKVPLGTPKCVKEGIKNNEICLEKVNKYMYRGEEVYFFITNCSHSCDYLLDRECDVLKDQNGNIICDCDKIWGGGRGTFNCDDFYNNRTNEELIWEWEK